MGTDIKALNRLKFGEVFYADEDIFFDCVFCKRVFHFSELNFVGHLESHVENSLIQNETNRFFCPMEDCEYSTKVKGLLSIHITDLHELIDQNPLEVQVQKTNIDSTESDNVGNFEVTEYKNYNCRRCNENFDTKLGFLEHLKENHTDQAVEDDVAESESLNAGNKRICSEIEYSSDGFYPFSNILIKNPKTKLNNNNFECIHCNEIFNYRSNLNRHLDKSHGIYSSLKFQPNQDGKYDCLKCDLVCSKVANLNFHMMRKHKRDFEKMLIEQQQMFDISKELNQKQVNKNFTAANLKNVEHNNLEEFMDDSNLQQSEQDDITMNPKELYVENNDNETLENSVEKLDATKLADFDGSSDDGATLVKNYKYIEKSSNNDYDCSHCSQIFRSRSNLNRHLQKKHGITSSLKFEPNKDGKYKCLKCDLICSKVANLNLHIMRKHEEDFKYLIIKQQLELNRSQKLMEQKILNDHQSIKTKEQNDLMEQPTYFDLEIENENNSGNMEIFKCDLCNTEMSSPDLFEQHLKTQHGIIIAININSDDSGIFKCPKCHVFSSNKIVIIHHVIQKHKVYYDELLMKKYETCVEIANNSEEKMELDSLTEKEENNDSDDFELYLERNGELFKDNTKEENAAKCEQSMFHDLKVDIPINSTNLKNNYPMLKLNPSSDGLYRCKKCNLICSRKSNLYVHLRRKHFEYFTKLLKNEDAEYKSDISDNEILENKNEDIMNFKCNLCAMRYSRRDNLNRHLKVKHGVLTTLNFLPNSNGKYQCKVCKLICEKKVSLHFHMQKKHTALFEKLLSKEQEQYTYTFKGDTRNRKSNARTTDDLNFSEVDGLWHCPHCEVVKTKPKLLRDHIREKHMKNSTCHFCGKELSSSCSLRNHLRTHQAPEYKCDYCNKLFAHKHNLNIHVRIHMGIKKYHCYYCEKRFVSLNEKKSHEKRIHIKEKTHVCDTCGSTFYTATRLKYHIQRHTGEKPFECDICLRRFYDRRLLRDHLVSHSTEKPFICDICNSRYARKVTLIKHKKKQHGILPTNPSANARLMESLENDN